MPTANKIWPCVQVGAKTKQNKKQEGVPLYKQKREDGVEEFSLWH